jgi:hypothetical protein
MEEIARKCHRCGVIWCSDLGYRIKHKECDHYVMPITIAIKRIGKVGYNTYCFNLCEDCFGGLLKYIKNEESWK